MHGPAGLRQGELNGVGDPVARRIRADDDAALHEGRQHGGVVEGLVRGIVEGCPRVTVGQVDQRAPVEEGMGEAGRAGAHAGTEGGEHGAGRSRELAGDRGHDARRALLVAEHEGQVGRARGLEELQIGAAAGHTEDSRHAGPTQAVNEDVGDGGHQDTGRIRVAASTSYVTTS
jgi:hypothetical protein